ncbi:ABC transporter substrate-binding protein [Halolactibacillus miurensis]|uniref:ABC transporter substrate-binding protein n=1 Tax=Halolactibacillus miurensis TaxID=306541 RepID=A0A1I6U185_9BACI|nr:MULTISPECIES: ABC transporter substrate-binding protein [Halolactibacillus]GEM04890.1 ABC transporter substrate-binding protein [Halolactibacillus miurensis]SFS95057.1 putative aldouronate transport system substrate-binding protein [Halolactibacillus miurensis]
MKKHLSVLFMLMLVGLLTLAACGDDSSDGGSDNDNTDNSSEDNGSDEPVTLTFFSSDGAEKTFDDPVAKKITEATGVYLEMDYPVGGNDEAIPLMIAGGEYPDLIFAKGDLGKLIDAGGVIKLDDMIEERGDNLKALYGDQIDRLRNSVDDPSIYQVGTYGVENQPLETSGTFQIQLEVLRELGYPEIDTLEDFEAALSEYHDMYPEINGQSTIPLSLQGSDWRWLITVGNPAGFAGGFPDDGQWVIDNDTGEATYKFVLDEFRTYFKWLNGMNAKGLLDPESFTQTQETYISKLSTGRVLSVADQDWNIGDARSALIQDGMENRTFAPLPVVLDESKTHQALKDYGFAGGWGIAISSTSEHQEEAFDFLDWMASEEAQILVNWGVEGEHYEVVDGERVMFDEVREKLETDANYSKESGVGYYIYPFPQWGTAAVDSNGQSITRDNKEQVIEGQLAPEKDALAAYGMELWIDWFPAQDELEISNHGAAANFSIPSGSDLQIIQQRADDITEQRITEAILADPAEFDGLWDNMLQELEDAGVEQLNQEMTELTQSVRELWGTN